jgi:RND family efflux transporter MFP subunit
MRLSACRSRSAIFFVGFLVAGQALGCGKPEKAADAPPAAPVTWEPPAELMLEEWSELLGFTQPLPDQIARVSAPVEARVASVLKDSDGKPVVEGEPVRQGTVIVRLDDAMIVANLAKLEAGLKELPEVELRAENQVQQASNDLNRLTKARQEEDQRAKSTGQPATHTLVPDVVLEKALFALRDAESNLRGAKLHRETAISERDALREQLKLFTLTAPISGQLGRIQVVQGQTVPAGTAVVDIVNLQPQIDVVCFVPPATAARLRRGQAARLGGVDQTPATATVAGPLGRVEFIAEQAEVETGNFAVKVRFPNEATRLRANMVLRLRVRTRDGEPCLAVHESALLEDQDPPAVIISTPVDFKDIETKDLPQPALEAVQTQFPNVSIKKVGKNTDWGLYKISLANVDDDVLVDAKGKIIKDKIGEARRLQASIGIRDRVKGMVQIRRLDDPEKKWQGKLDEALFITSNGQGLQNGDKVKLPAEEDEAPPPEK